VLFLALVLLIALFYVASAVTLALTSVPVEPVQAPRARLENIAIFGASGTAGDGILKAALASPDIRTIQVITRRATPRINEGVETGKVQMTLHTDYLDYSAIHAQIAHVDAVFWAIGTSSVGVDERTYGQIHVDFPARFVADWMSTSERPAISFHYISSSDISEDSKMMWAREKVRAEQTLYKLASDSKLRVIFYRPDYIRPTAEEAHLGQDLLYWFFAPVGVAVKATQIGHAMIEVTARGEEFGHGDKLSTRKIIQYSDAYERISSHPVKGSAD